MASKPVSVAIRSYQVGFGDCFLLTFSYAKEPDRHVLIDFGTSKLPGSLKPSEHMPRVAEDIKNACGGRLDAVVVTHRHLDHLSGFATDGGNGGAGTTIAQCRPKVVVQPWTEDPKAAEDATHATADSVRTPKSFVAGLTSMHQLAEAVAAMTASPPPTLSADTVKRLRFIGETNVKNKSAVENLIAMGSGAGVETVWAHHGTPAAGSQWALERVLPGVTVHVLGPPNLAQTESIRKMKSRDPDEFWMLLAGPSGSVGRGAAPLPRAAADRSPAPVPPEARWFRDCLERVSGEQLLQIVTVLDQQMNNTSLILLFEIGKTKLLFPGDAQLENWSYALEDAPSADATRNRLANVDLYKVGHHGSRNATPKQLLWERFRNRGATRKLVTLLSTLPGKHHDVPRKTLVDALKAETTLYNTNDLPKGAGGKLYELVTLEL
jgi:hypothetical protein